MKILEAFHMLAPLSAQHHCQLRPCPRPKETPSFATADTATAESLLGEGKMSVLGLQSGYTVNMAWALGLRPYFTVYPSSCPNTDTFTYDVVLR